MNGAFSHVVSAGLMASGTVFIATAVLGLLADRPIPLPAGVSPETWQNLMLAIAVAGMLLVGIGAARW